MSTKLNRRDAETQSFVRLDFIARMEAEIHANQRKGDWATWQPTEAVGMVEVYHHVGKLRNALLDKNKKEISEFCADIANLVMKIEEVHGLGALAK